MIIQHPAHHHFLLCKWAHWHTCPDKVRTNSYYHTSSEIRQWQTTRKCDIRLRVYSKTVTLWQQHSKEYENAHSLVKVSVGTDGPFSVCKSTQNTGIIFIMPSCSLGSSSFTEGRETQQHYVSCSWTSQQIGCYIRRFVEFFFLLKTNCWV